MTTTKTEKNNVAITSVKQLPAIFKKMDIVPGTVNLDIGGGKYDIGTKFMKEHGATNLIYDPYNRLQEETDCVINYLTSKEKVDTATISNVLNVVESYGTRSNMLKFAKSNLKSLGVCYISVYEGDKTGVGKVTKTGSFQANRRTEDYLREVGEVFENVMTRKGIIIARN